MVPAISWDPTIPFPSCLLTGVTWDPHYVIGLQQEVQSPESCQLSCSDNEDCAGFSWISEDIDLIVAHSCLLFSQIEEETPHKSIISGPPSCPCTISGGCVADDHNVLDAIPDIADADQCKKICSETEGCVAYIHLLRKIMSSLISVCFTLLVLMLTLPAQSALQELLIVNIAHLQRHLLDSVVSITAKPVFIVWFFFSFSVMCP